MYITPLLQGTYLARLPRRSQPGHQRMVCCATWASDDKAANLFTCGFDNRYTIYTSKCTQFTLQNVQKRASFALTRTIFRTIAWKVSIDHDR